MDTEAKMKTICWQWLAWSQLTLVTLYAVLQLRQEVFIVEQNCTYLDADGEDSHCHHLLGWKDGELVAYVRVLPPGIGREDIVISRVITKASIRRQGWGRPLLQRAETQAQHTFGSHGFFLSAQAHLEKYYSSMGYQVCGPGYDEDGIPHLPMQKAKHFPGQQT